MAYFALILDWHLYSHNPKLRLLATAASEKPLFNIQTYDPASDFTDVLRAQFSVLDGPPHVVQNEFTGTLNPAHVCQLVVL